MLKKNLQLVFGKRAGALCFDCRDTFSAPWLRRPHRDSAARRLSAAAPATPTAAPTPAARSACNALR